MVLTFKQYLFPNKTFHAKKYMILEEERMSPADGMIHIYVVVMVVLFIYDIYGIRMKNVEYFCMRCQYLSSMMYDWSMTQSTGHLFV